MNLYEWLSLVWIHLTTPNATAVYPVQIICLFKNLIQWHIFFVNKTWPLNYSKGINSVTHIFGPRKTLIFFDRKIRTHTYFCLLLKLSLFPWRYTYHSRTEKEKFDVDSKWLDCFDCVYICMWKMMTQLREKWEIVYNV